MTEVYNIYSDGNAKLVKYRIRIFSNYVKLIFFWMVHLSIVLSV